MTGETPSPAVLSRPVRVTDLSDREKRFHVVAGPAECEALARELDILSVERLEADVVLRLLDAKATAARLTGHMEAEVVQSCVVTLEPVAERISADIERHYALCAAPEDDGDDIEIALDSEEPAEPVSNGTIDIGVAVAEQLALDLEPFPRAPGVAFEGYSSGEVVVETPANPFAALAALKREEGGGQG